MTYLLLFLLLAALAGGAAHIAILERRAQRELEAYAEERKRALEQAAQRALEQAAQHALEAAPSSYRQEAEVFDAEVVDDEVLERRGGGLSPTAVAFLAAGLAGACLLKSSGSRKQK